ncbi:MAG: hypothetical protein IJE16_08945 [Ruminococcus sp.]|nr:hypothetical protein [Ruminococcus sp.]
MKKALCCILALLVICISSLCVTSAQSTDDAVVFKNIEQLRKTITDIYNDNYDELVKIAHKVRIFECDDKYITYYPNCGPCSTAFQSILYDNSIITETTIGCKRDDHIFNFYRTAFTDSEGAVSSIIIDTTYKQYVTAYYTQSGLRFDDIAKDLPPVLVYEYGNIEEMTAQLSGALNSIDEESFSSMCNSIFDNQYYYQYIPQDFQELDFKPTMNYTSEFLDALRNKSGFFEYNIHQTLLLNSTENDYQKEFIYDNNGVYRCYIPSTEVSSIITGFNIISPETDSVYGAKDSTDTLRLIPNFPSSKSEDDVKLIHKGSQTPLTLNTQGIKLPILLSVDFRAGENSPAIFAYTVGRQLSYGDVNLDNTVDIMDSTYLQMVLAKCENYTLDVFSKESANVLKTTKLNINNATEINRYLAKYDSKYCGQNMFFSSALELSCSESMGYIDVAVK